MHLIKVIENPRFWIQFIRLENDTEDNQLSRIKSKPSFRNHLALAKKKVDCVDIHEQTPTSTQDEYNVKTHILRIVVSVHAMLSRLDDS